MDYNGQTAVEPFPGGAAVNNGLEPRYLVDPQTGETLIAAEENFLPQEQEQETEAINIVICNVVCCFSVRSHINLRKVASESTHVIYKREQGMVSMKIRKPSVTASIWSSGKITCTGATSEEEALTAARKIARKLQKVANFRVVNVLGTVSMPWAIDIQRFSSQNNGPAMYEPEIHPGVTYRLKQPKATLKIFSTGSITITAARISFVQNAVEFIYPLVLAHSRPKETLSTGDKLAVNQYLTNDVASEKPSRAPKSRKKRQKSESETDTDSGDSSD